MNEPAQQSSAVWAGRCFRLANGHSPSSLLEQLLSIANPRRAPGCSTEGMKRAGNPALAPRDRFTYRRYRTWPDEERGELIDGVAWAMSPAPIRIRYHRRIAGRFYTRLEMFLEGKPCRASIAPDASSVLDGFEIDPTKLFEAD